MKKLTAATTAWFVAWTALVAVVLSPKTAVAEVTRYAVIVGNNRGDGGDIELKYAEAEAARVHDVLKDVGGFAPSNSVVLRGESIDALRGALTATSERLHATAAAGGQSLFFFYYSGHADATAMHVGGRRLDWSELEQRIAGIPSTLRLVVVDACRSGAVTRTKGGRVIAPFDVSISERLDEQGTIFLSSSAANEDAQESDDIGGSFFTHAFVSGLLGAADTNGDGRVSLEESYRYAYEATLRTTARTAAGPQHASFRFDLRGRGALILTDLTRNTRARAKLTFPAGRSYLILSSREGSVIAEVGENDRHRQLTLRPGRYFVRGRAANHLLEGEITATAGSDVEVSDRDLSRVAYARLVRKGGGDARVVHGPAIGFRVRSPLGNETDACVGGYVAYPLHFHVATLEPRVGYCEGDFANERLRATVREANLAVRLVRSFDTNVVTFDAGLALGGAFFAQSFETRGAAPSRQSPAGFGTLGLGLTRSLGAGFEASILGEAGLYVLRLSDGGSDVLRASPTLQGSLGIARLF